MSTQGILKRQAKQGGYSLLMVVFMVATILVLAGAVAPNLLTQGRREREQELAWRGEQYERAIGLYYKKFGRYPTKVDDLVKQTNGVRFLRQAYKDPTNKEDGSWRFIYVGPNGQLIGSLRQSNLLQSVLSGPAVPVSQATGSAPVPGTASAAMTFGAGGTPGGAAAGQPGTASGQTPGAPGANPLESQPTPLGGTVLGGNIIGVGSKSKESSLRLYLGADTYEKWEFIWDPNQTGQGLPGTPGVGPGVAPVPPGGATPAGTPPPSPQSPTDSNVPPGTTPLPTSP